MSAQLLEVGTVNAFNTTLNGTITNSDNEIILTTTTGLVAPGVLVIDRKDANNVATPSLREYISFTGISVNTLTGCSRGLAGSTAQQHLSGAIVEEVFSVTHWGDMIDFLQVSHDAAGRIVTSTVTITTHINASGASLTGFFLDQDDMVSNSALLGATQQSTKAYVDKLKKIIEIKIIDDTTVLTTGDGKLHFFIPSDLNGYNLVDADAAISTVSSSGTPTVQIYNVTQTADMLSTRITIDENEKTSYTAATAPVIDTGNDDVATGDEIRIDCDVAGTGTKGLTVILVFQLP